MRVTPLAFDSMGVRSQATRVETPDAAITLDPAVALGPRRYNLPPHPREYAREEELRRAVEESARTSQVLVVSHYHYDHHDPHTPQMARGKTLLLKHPQDHINQSQRGRSRDYLKKIGEGPKKIEYADHRTFQFGKTRIEFSPPVFHGTSDHLGYVVEAAISHGGEKALFASDVQGPPHPDQAKFILEQKPDILLVDGPMTYMLGYRYPPEALRQSEEHLLRILRETEVETLVADHHFLRDPRHTEYLPRARAAARERGARFLTAAELAGRPLEPLESQRRELYKKEPAPKREYTRFKDI
ncbi:MAG: hypothetical protein HY558_03135 [Euryarchaeota archaeon]|nr:hypothetical protein [Euryarchaeota archaeon]